MIFRQINALLILLMFLVIGKTEGQVYSERNSKITIRINTQSGLAEYVSNQFLVSLNRNFNRFECFSDISTFAPIDKKAKKEMLQDVFYSSKYPKLNLYIEAPVQKLNAKDLKTETLNLKGTLFFQAGVKNVEIPVTITTDPNYISFSTGFEFNLAEFEAEIPQKYISSLTGRIQISIVNANWNEAYWFDRDYRE